MEVETISKELIKPSSPTPHHLKSYKLSFLDLYTPPIYIPVFLYYSVNQDTILISSIDIDHIVSTKLQVLKQSLSETLSYFYPLAGRIKDLYSIDCNDEGLYFVEARVKSSSPLNEFLSHPEIFLIKKFLPDDAKWSAGLISGNYVAGIQVTKFACGGIVVGALVSHMILDGAAFGWFLKSWAAKAALKNTEEATYPKFNASSLFPQNNAYPREVCSPSLLNLFLKFGKYITRRFLFDASAIAKLKAKATSSGVENSTRFEVVTALLGKCITAALKVRSGSDGKPYLLTHAVNLRPRATPPFSENYMGNFVWMASFLNKDEEAELHDLVSQLREARRKFNGDLMSSFQGDGGLLNFLEAIKYDNETYSSAEDNIVFTSWLKFGFYDVDFGWGKPAWASIYGFAESMIFHNGVILMDIKLGDGVEAWVSMREEDMSILQLDKELFAFAAMDSSPLKEDNPLFPDQDL